MSGTSLLAFGAGAAAVVGAWHVLAELDAARLRAWLGAAAEPVVRAGTEGRAPARSERRRAAVLGALVLAACGWLVGGPAAAALAALAGPAAVAALVRARRRAFAARVAGAAAPVARAVADALAGGASVRGAVAAAGAAATGPAASVLHEAARALAAGESTDRALERVRRRAASPAWDTLVAAILLQRDAGGDLAGALRDLAASLEAAERIERDARAATAQARFTAWLVGLLPLAAAVVAQLADPGFVARLLGHPVSVWLAGAAAILQVAGVLAVRRLAR